MATTFDNFLHNVLKDLRVELTDEFDRNFERKAFFTDAWPATKRAVSRGSLMMRTGDLRAGNKTEVLSNGLSFTNSMPYAAIHNEGGTLTVTAAMKKYFWAMYYKASGGVTTKKSGQVSKSKRNMALTQEAEYFKGLALMKVGSKLKIPQRQFIGPHNKVDEMVQQVLDENVKELAAYIAQRLK
jgi:phage gpG-like protein